MILNLLYTRNGVGYLTEEKEKFELDYIRAREKENRILIDNEVSILPKTFIENPNKKEWELREKSTKRILKYLESKNGGLSILDIGCGNGWFTNKLASISKENKIIGLDVNTEELEQAVRLFGKEKTCYCYGDIFKLDNFEEQFDIIILNASVQYFSDFNELFLLLKSFLKLEGEIHIIDSPFYKKEELFKAKDRTDKYYENLGFPQMTLNYFHHEITKVKDFEILYMQNRSIFHKILKRNDSPFPWLRFVKK
ncbi:methyltransferase domain-containing protein [Tenacibaculum ovolyticum]|uniref:methyltransferase domain-containing protein n=1 Tax=Tenacibaculum ovolyticum TaxID=104270 RepID=UPI00042268B9|nr:methyltransferase domain-containing protein [Tenacibaculum ovolyticum]